MPATRHVERAVTLLQANARSQRFVRHRTAERRRSAALCLSSAVDDACSPLGVRRRRPGGDKLRLLLVGLRRQRADRRRRAHLPPAGLRAHQARVAGHADERLLRHPAAFGPAADRLQDRLTAPTPGSTHPPALLATINPPTTTLPQHARRASSLGSVSTSVA